ncbi:hypothetical protein GCM10022236_04540 [Microlunatus ginsengisoli]|uniref:Uncharacterized protein n=1 Tax=Microlunatus ginsengisoli TaxID=363863 RepID=A0ABP6ZE23_9ACTN
MKQQEHAAGEEEAQVRFEQGYGGSCRPTCAEELRANIHASTPFFSADSRAGRFGGRGRWSVTDGGMASSVL